MHATPRFAAVLLAASFAVPLFAQTPAWEAPKGGYDTPATFATRIEDAGTVYTRVLGEARKNVYGRQVTLKVAGLAELQRLTALKGSIDKGAAKEEERQAKSADGQGGQLGSLLSKLNPLMAKEVDRQKEEAQDELTVSLLEAGSPQDQPGTAVADLINPPNQVTGSFLGAKVNDKVKVLVTSTEFKPKVLIVRYLPKGSFTPMQADARPSFSVVASSDAEGDAGGRALATFSRSTKSADGGRDIAIIVTSDDGRAASGQYQIKYYQE